MCRQLGIVTYHPEVGASPPQMQVTNAGIRVPAAKIQLVKSVKLPPRQSVVADASGEQEQSKGPYFRKLILHSGSVATSTFWCLMLVPRLVQPKVVLTNCLGFTQELESGKEIGTILPVDLRPVKAKKRTCGLCGVGREQSCPKSRR